MKRKRILSLLLAVLMVAVGLAACGGGDNKPQSAEGLNLSVCLAAEPETIDPAKSAAMDVGNMLVQSFEGLMTWEDDGHGIAVVTNGQAESYDKKENADGTVTYTFKLRDGVKWSDGKPVVAGDFEYTMKRLVDPKTGALYNYMIDMVVNAKEIIEGAKPADTLGVKALDDTTIQIDLTYDCPYFMEVLAFGAVMPVRQDIIEQYGDEWTLNPDTYLSNGPLKVTERKRGQYILMEPNEHYYNPEKVKINSVKFFMMDDANAQLSAFQNGDLDFFRDFPVDEVPALLESGQLKVVDHLGTYYVAFNNEAKPFDDAKVRKAFSLVIDRNRIVDEITQGVYAPADGWVPPGVADAKGPEGKDFRAVGGGYYSIAAADYEKNCEEARKLLAEAGYPNGEGFPVIEYLYNTNDQHRAIAEALQNMWKKELNVDVTLANQDWGVFLENRRKGNFTFARHGWVADYNDPITFIDLFVSDGGNNNGRYNNPKYDEYVKTAKETSDPQKRMEAMHNAEALLMEDAGIAPIYFYKDKYMFNDKLEGMYYTPLGYFFFEAVTEKQ